jgi:hypothetical protein
MFLQGQQKCKVFLLKPINVRGHLERELGIGCSICQSKLINSFCHLKLIHMSKVISSWPHLHGKIVLDMGSITRVIVYESMQLPVTPKGKVMSRLN